MVDDRALRFQRRPMGEPPGQTRTPMGEPPNQRRTPVGEPPNQTRTQREESPNFLQQIAPFLGVQEYEPGDSYWDKVSKNWASNPMNPIPQTWGAISDGRAPTGGELGTDAAFLAGASLVGPAAGVGAGLRHAAPLFDEAARRVPRNVPIALAEFLNFPKTGYMPNLTSRATGQNNVKLFDDFFGQTDEIVPRGTELYRAPNASQVAPYPYSRSVPLPREAGAEFLPGVVQSFGNSADLNRLGAIMRGLIDDTGGAAARAPGAMKITTMDDIPGIKDLPQFLSRYADDIPNNLPIESEFVGEGLLGPATRYILRDFNPGNIPASLRGAYGRLTQPLGQADYQVPTWIFEAFRG